MSSRPTGNQMKKVQGDDTACHPNKDKSNSIHEGNIKYSSGKQYQCGNPERGEILEAVSPVFIRLTLLTPLSSLPINPSPSHVLCFYVEGKICFCWTSCSPQLCSCMRTPSHRRVWQYLKTQQMGTGTPKKREPGQHTDFPTNGGCGGKNKEERLWFTSAKHLASYPSLFQRQCSALTYFLQERGTRHFSCAIQ